MFRSCVRSFSSTAAVRDAFFDKVISNLNKPVAAVSAATPTAQKTQSFRRPTSASGARAEPSGKRFQNGAAKDGAKKPFNRNSKNAKAKKAAGPKVSNKRTKDINPPVCEFARLPYVPSTMDRLQLLQETASVFGYSPESRVLRAEKAVQQFNNTTVYTASEKADRVSQVAAEAVAACVSGEVTLVKFNAKAYKNPNVAVNAHAAARAIERNVNLPASIKENLFQVVSGAKPVKVLNHLTSV